MLSVSAPCFPIIDDGKENGMIDGGKEYTYPLELFACKEALLRGFKARQTWTLREFAYLLAGFSPQVVDNNLEESEWFQTDVLPFRLLLGEAVTENADTEYFNGYAPTDVQRNYGDTAYPVEAFIDFCSKRKIDFPLKAEIDDYFRPSFAAESAPATVAPSPESAEVADGLTVVAVPSVDDIQLISGVTVANIRALFDKDNPRYRPPLAAAVWLWCSFESKGVPVGMTPKQEAKRRLGAEIPPAISTDWTDKTDEEILKMVNWQKKPKKE